MKLRHQYMISCNKDIEISMFGPEAQGAADSIPLLFRAVALHFGPNFF
jgi:hypothetical protein